MNTPDLERRLTDLLRKDAEDAMNTIDTEDDLDTLRRRVGREVRTRRLMTVAGLAAAAVGVVALAIPRGEPAPYEPAGPASPAAPSSPARPESTHEQSTWGSNVVGDDPDPDDGFGREFHCPYGGLAHAARPASEGADLELTDVRVGGVGPKSGELSGATSHDRVVFEFTGVGTPGWDLGYVRDMSSTIGDPLQVTISGVTAPWSEETLVGEALPDWQGKPLVTGEPGYSIVRQVQVGSGVTGYDESVRSRIFAGSSLPGGAEFCVNLLQSPTRVVISFPYMG